jgi:hypothetical protein
MDKSILKDISSSVLFGLEVLGVALTHGLTAEDGLDALQHLLGQLGQYLDGFHSLDQLFGTGGASDGSRDVGVDDAPGHRQLGLGASELIGNSLELGERFEGLLLLLFGEVHVEDSEQVWVVVVSGALGDALIVLSREYTSCKW